MWGDREKVGRGGKVVWRETPLGEERGKGAY